MLQPIYHLVTSSTLNTSLYSPNTVISTLTSEISIFIFKQPNITIISVMVFLCISKLLDFSNFQICFYSSNVQTNFIHLESLLLIFLQFSLSITNLLIPSINLKLKFLYLVISITSKLIQKIIYNLKLVIFTLFQHLKKKALKEFIEKNLNT